MAAIFKSLLRTVKLVIRWTFTLIEKLIQSLDLFAF